MRNRVGRSMTLLRTVSSHTMNSQNFKLRSQIPEPLLIFSSKCPFRAQISQGLGPSSQIELLKTGRASSMHYITTTNNNNNDNNNNNNNDNSDNNKNNPNSANNNQQASADIATELPCGPLASSGRCAGSCSGRRVCIYIYIYRERER